MIQESYDMVERLVKEMQERVSQAVYKLEKIDKDTNIIAKIQQSIIDFGSNIERSFHIEESELIQNFQCCCEMLYQYCISETNGKEILDTLINKVSAWNTALSQSIKIRDRKLSLVVIVRDEGDYLEEWLEYHFLAGVSHIYLYDNESTDHTNDILKDYIEKGLVTYIWWPGKAAQLPAYNHALENFKYDTYYMGFIDADEFLVSVQSEKLGTVIDAAFKTGTERLRYIGGGQCGGIGVNWRMYGTSFHKEKPNGLVIENYKYRAVDTYIENGHIKTICNPRAAVAFERNPHCIRYLSGYYCTSENGSYIPDAFFYDSMCINLRINHYYSKSEAELVKRLKKGKAKENDKKLSEDQIDRRLKIVTEKFNERYDPIMDRYITDVKRKLIKSNYTC